MIGRSGRLMVLLLALAAVGCSRSPEAVPTLASAATAPPTAAPSPTPAPQMLATRIGADYVLLLPRESALPAGWVMSPSPDYDVRRPAAGDTYRFACEDLAARSVGRASVGYRHLEGLPSVHIEYVIYPTNSEADDALADMEAATGRCAEFVLGEGDGATTAAFAALDFPAYGDAAFARALSTSGSLSGDLTTHMIKVRQGHVVIGISHANYADGGAPDDALTESLVALAISNLRNGPAAPGK